MKTSIILCSGGLDSVTLAHYVKKKLQFKDNTLLFFDYGQMAIHNEEKCAIFCANVLKARFIKIRISDLGKLISSGLTRPVFVRKLLRKDLANTRKESLQWYLPFRNGIFLSYALALGENMLLKNKVKPTIFVGFKSEGVEHYPDTSPSFIHAMNALSSVASKSIRISAPFITKDKEDIITIGSKLNVDFSKTISCYQPNKKACGKCLSCMLRKEAFYWANLSDPSIKN